jgi:hypothetical protein
VLHISLCVHELERGCVRACACLFMRVLVSTCVHTCLSVRVSSRARWRVRVLTYHEKRMRSFVLSAVGCLAPSHFCTLSHIMYHFWKKKFIEHTLFLFSLQHISEAFLILRIIYRDIIINMKT